MATLYYYWKIALKIHPNTFSSSFPLEVYLLVVVVIPIRSSFLGNIFCDDVIPAWHCSCICIMAYRILKLK